MAFDPLPGDGVGGLNFVQNGLGCADQLSIGFGLPNPSDHICCPFAVKNDNDAGILNVLLEEEDEGFAKSGEFPGVVGAHSCAKELWLSVVGGNGTTAFIQEIGLHGMLCA